LIDSIESGAGVKFLVLFFITNINSSEFDPLKRTVIYAYSLLKYSHTFHDDEFRIASLKP